MFFQNEAVESFMLKHKNPYLYVVSLLPSSGGVVFPCENGVLDLDKWIFFSKVYNRTFLMDILTLWEKSE